MDDGGERVSRMIAIIVGICWALLIEFLGFITAGMGEAWGTPAQIGLSSFLICPLAALIWRSFRSVSWFAFAGMAIIATALDVFIVLSTQHEGIQYFEKSGEFAYIWILAWSSWQIVLFRLAMVRLRDSL